METSIGQAVERLTALASEHRLAVFRALVRAGRGGMSAGDIASRVGLAPSSLSFHLAALRHAGLVSDERAGRSIIYRADYDAIGGLVSYLMENCCAGDFQPSCGPLTENTPCASTSA